MELHTAMMGGDWKAPTYDTILDHQHDYIELITRFQSHGLWGIKDPRLCYLLPFLIMVDPSIKVIAVFRDPYVAANSLYVRGGHTLEEAREISLQYCKAMFVAVPDDATWIYYNDLVESPVVGVADIAKYLGVEPTQAAIDFVDKDLRHWR